MQSKHKRTTPFEAAAPNRDPAMPVSEVTLPMPVGDSDWIVDQAFSAILGLGHYDRTLSVLGVPFLLERLKEPQQIEVLRDSWEPEFRH